MHRKITRLARAGKCVGLAARPSFVRVPRAAASCARPAKARYPNPEASDWSATRREVAAPNPLARFSLDAISDS